MKKLIFACLFYLFFTSVAGANFYGDFLKAGIDITGSDISVASLAVTTILTTENNIGAIDAATGLTLVEVGDGVTHKTIFTLSDVDLALVDEAGVVAYAGLQLYDFPAGYIYMIGASQDLAITLSAAGVDADFNGDIALGTITATNNATLATTEQNIIPTTAIPQATASVTTGDAVSTATEHAIIDGHTTAVDLFINALVDDADHDVTSTPTNLILNGTITIVWTSLGDN